MYNGHTDVTELIDGMGEIIGSYYYDTFGNITEQSGDADNPFKYANYLYDDESGLYYLNARYYDPKIARFITEDTYRGEANDPLSLNLYAYCDNNPIIYDDPTGHSKAGTQESTHKDKKDIQKEIKDKQKLIKESDDPDEKKALQAEINKLEKDLKNAIEYTVRIETAKQKPVQQPKASNVANPQQDSKRTVGQKIGVAVDAVKSYGIGVSHAVVQDYTYNTVNPDPQAVIYMEATSPGAYYNGKDLGHMITTVVSVIEGAGGATGGVVFSETGVGAIAGSAVVSHATSVGITSRTNALVDDIKQQNIIYAEGESKSNPNSARQAAVRDAWKQEQQLVKETGQGTRPWTKAEKKELLETGKVKGYEGHHINNVNNNPDLARNPDNIKFVKGRAEHLEEHSGNFRNPTSGDLINRK